MYPNVHSSNGHNHQTVERAKMPFNRWMDKEDMVHIYNKILCLHQKGWIPNFCINKDRTGGDYAEWSKSSRESQLSYGFTYLWSIRNNMEDIRRRKGKVNWGKAEGETKHERLWTLRTKLRVLEGRGLGKPSGGYWGGHVLHGALGVVQNNKSCNTEKNELNK